MPPSHALFQAPSLALLVAEPLRAALDFCAAHLAWPAPGIGDGHPVVIYPGLGAGSLQMSQLRGWLRASGFTVHDWLLGVNTGPDADMEAWFEGLVAHVRSLEAQHGRKVSLVGWSLGGLYAREIAKAAPEAVRQVVTLATPFGAVEDANHAGTLLRLLGGTGRQALTPALRARLRLPPPVPSTSIYSRSDGVVCWRGCLQAPGPQAENIAVDTSHLGIVSHPQALRIVADRLAQPEGQWRPWRRASRPTRTSAPSRSRK